MLFNGELEVSMRKANKMNCYITYSFSQVLYQLICPSFTQLVLWKSREVLEMPSGSVSCSKLGACSDIFHLRGSTEDAFCLVYLFMR